MIEERTKIGQACGCAIGRVPMPMTEGQSVGLYSVYVGGGGAEIYVVKAVRCAPCVGGGALTGELFPRVKDMWAISKRGRKGGRCQRGDAHAEGAVAEHADEPRQLPDHRLIVRLRGQAADAPRPGGGGVRLQGYINHYDGYKVV